MIKKLLSIVAVMMMALPMHAEKLTQDFGQPNNNLTAGDQVWFDAATNKITFHEAWSYRPGWWWGEKDLSQYDEIVLTLADATADVIQLQLELTDGTNLSATGKNEIVIALPDQENVIAKQMYLQCPTAGTTATFVSAVAQSAAEVSGIPLTLTEGHTILATEFDKYADATKVKMSFANNTDPYASRQGWGIGQFSNSDNWSANEYSFKLTGLDGKTFDIMCTVGDMKKAAMNGTGAYVPGEYHAGGITFNVYNDCKLTGVYILVESSGINDIVAPVKGDGRMYNLMGVPVDDNYKGIVIKDGKKYYNR